jgi:hypothetical protein
LQRQPGRRESVFLPAILAKGRKSQETNGETIAALPIFDKRPREVNLFGTVFAPKNHQQKSDLRSGAYLMQ